MWRALLSPPCAAFCKLRELSQDGLGQGDHSAQRQCGGHGAMRRNHAVAAPARATVCFRAARWFQGLGREAIQGVREMDGVMVVVNHMCAR